MYTTLDDLRRLIKYRRIRYSAPPVDRTFAMFDLGRIRSTATTERLPVQR